MEMRRVLICVALMAIVTYIPRVLPLTLFQLSDEHDCAVVEMGMSNFGEMEQLS